MANAARAESNHGSNLNHEKPFQYRDTHEGLVQKLCERFRQSSVGSEADVYRSMPYMDVRHAVNKAAAFGSMIRSGGVAAYFGAMSAAVTYSSGLKEAAAVFAVVAGGGALSATAAYFGRQQQKKGIIARNL